MLSLTKKEVVIRNTNQAIKMFFNREEPVSILLISCAANEILSTLIKTKGLITPVGRNSYLIKDEYRREVSTVRNKMYNFCKHADRDFNLSIDFNPEINWIFILENIAMIEQLGYTLSTEMKYFYMWILVAKPNLILDKTLLNTYLDKLQNIKEDDLFNNYDEIINL